MKTLINPRLTFVLGVVIALVTVWCNAVPAGVDAEGMSEATGGCYALCEDYDYFDCENCDDEYLGCAYAWGDNNQTCEKKDDKGCPNRPCKPINVEQKRCK